MKFSKHKLGFLGALIAFGIGSSISSFAGWQNLGGAWAYQNEAGQYQTGWVNDQGVYYFMDASGFMKTGWIIDNGAWYYMDPTSGAMRTGWVQDGNDWYYLYQNGMMAAGGTLQLDGKDYTFDASGKMLQNTNASAESTNNIPSYEVLKSPSKFASWYYGYNNDDDNPITSNKLPSINDPTPPFGSTGFWTPVDTNYKHDEFVEGVVELTNEERRKHGRSELVVSDELMEIADIRAEEISEKYSHTREDGTQVEALIEEEGYNYSYVGENISGGHASPEAAVNSWMNSSGHRSNILNKNYGQIGVGFYCAPNGNQCWVQVFAK